MLKSNGDLVRCVNSKTNQVIKIQRWICDDTFGSDKQRRDAQLWQSATGFKPQEVEPLQEVAEEYRSTVKTTTTEIIKVTSFKDSSIEPQSELIDGGIAIEIELDPKFKKNIPQKRKRK